MNVLILNVDGGFELRQRPPFDISRNDPTIVVRHETFIRGNDYVGAAAAGDDRLIRQLYESSLEAWLEHLKTGETQEYSDTSSQRDKQELLDEVEKIRSGWTPQY